MNVLNIFAVDRCPQAAAKALCNSHCVKMVLESAQMLSTIARQKGIEIDGQYKSTHQNHPCTQWAASNSDHLGWLCLHASALCAEYTYRYGKIHKSQAVIEDLWAVLSVTYAAPKSFAQAMPDQYKDYANPVAAYRNYYRAEKATIAKWSTRNPPDWFHSL